MSTEFRTAQTDEWVCTRWAGSPDPDAQAFDFGSRARFEALEALALDTDVELVSETMERTTLRELLVTGTSSALWTPGGTRLDPVTGLTSKSEARQLRLEPTFGKFCGTVELGTGELFERLGLA